MKNYVVYGIIQREADGSRGWLRRSITREFDTEDDARVYLVTQLIKAEGKQLSAVIVHLLGGTDRNGYRTVSHRVGDGKAWWE